MSLNTCEWVANSLDLDQKSTNMTSDMDVHLLCAVEGTWYQQNSDQTTRMHKS